MWHICVYTYMYAYATQWHFTQLMNCMYDGIIWRCVCLRCSYTLRCLYRAEFKHTFPRMRHSHSAMHDCVFTMFTEKWNEKTMQISHELFEAPSYTRGHLPWEYVYTAVQTEKRCNMLHARRRIREGSSLGQTKFKVLRARQSEGAVLSVKQEAWYFG